MTHAELGYLKGLVTDAAERMGGRPLIPGYCDAVVARYERLRVERDPQRCGLCQAPSSTPACRRCQRVLEGERPPRRARA